MDKNHLVPLAVPLAGGLPPLGLSTGGLAFLSLPLEFPTDGLDPFICSLELLLIQWCAIEMEHLLHKPYVYEVTSIEHNLY